MFNNPNQENNPNRPAVDDIFAETDQSSAPAGNNPPQAPAGGGSIDAHRVGLTTGQEEMEPTEASSGPWFKIALIIIIVLIILLGGYLVYSKFFQASEIPVDDPGLNNPPVGQDEAPLVEPVSPTPEEPEVPVTNPEIVPLIPGINAPLPEEPEEPVNPVEPSEPEETLDTDGDGLSDYEETYIYGTSQTSVDTDVDGLSDYEEVKVYGTDPLITDTDGDALNDYEEVKVYGSDPLNPDTDGDTYLDGSEVANGYSPLGPGPLEIE